MPFLDELKTILDMICTNTLINILVGMTLGLAIVVVHAYFAYKKKIK